MRGIHRRFRKFSFCIATLYYCALSLCNIHCSCCCRWNSSVEGKAKSCKFIHMISSFPPPTNHDSHSPRFVLLLSITVSAPRGMLHLAGQCCRAMGISHKSTLTGSPKSAGAAVQSGRFACNGVCQTFSRWLSLAHASKDCNICHSVA